METQVQNQTNQTAAFSLDDLKAALADAGEIAKALVGDKFHGASQFAASIRSVVDHAADLVALQEKWAAEKQAAPIVAASAQTPAPAPTPATPETMETAGN